MNTDTQLSGSVGNEIEFLIENGRYIEHKFDVGRADDIRPQYIQEIINLAVSSRRKTSNPTLQTHLIKIENYAYAIKDNFQQASYYQNLRILAGLLTGLVEFNT